MSEIESFKQKFLLGALDTHEYQDCCLFSDATKVFTEERECVRHSVVGKCESCRYVGQRTLWYSSVDC